MLWCARESRAHCVMSRRLRRACVFPGIALACYSIKLRLPRYVLGSVSVLGQCNLAILWRGDSVTDFLNLPLLSRHGWSDKPTLVKFFPRTVQWRVTVLARTSVQVANGGCSKARLPFG